MKEPKGHKVYRILYKRRAYFQSWDVAERMFPFFGAVIKEVSGGYIVYYDKLNANVAE